ncbi:hypothetical protein [Streptomyces sp. NPDC008001]|uniref:hypothetical protein n=1 Tax=Streptomyces sp. NPDC008001 TaxID=3364804 RepID=UPI0036E691D4
MSASSDSGSGNTAAAPCSASAQPQDYESWFTMLLAPVMFPFSAVADLFQHGVATVIQHFPGLS